MNNKVIKVGVFDSGVGGAYIANEINKKFADVELLVREDKDNLPYGNKSKDQLKALVLPILLDMEAGGCDVIVVACNTVTTNIIEDLRTKISVPLVGIEPMIKPASEISKSGVITVCATPTTLSSNRYKWLKSQYADNIQVLEPECSTWAQMIEDNNVNEDKITEIVELSKQNNADVIVLGCTHYHWIFELINQLAGDSITVLQPSDAVIKQLGRVIEQLG